MKKLWFCTYLIISMFLVYGALDLSFGQIRYVDKDATGLNNGTSWVNAWTSFTNVVWSQVTTLYISDGAYNEPIIVGASNILITKGIDAGHNGEVIIQGSGSSAGININDKTYVTVSNLTVNDWFINIKIDGNSAEATHHIIIDNCDGRMSGRFVHIQGFPNQTGSYTHDITIKNCDVTTPDSIGNQNDFVYAQYMAGLTIENNNVNISNKDSSSHCDMVQTLWVDGTVIVRNNYFEHSNTK